MTPGLMAAISAYESPFCSMTRELKFSTTASETAMRRLMISIPLGWFRLSVMLRLFRLRLLKRPLPFGLWGSAGGEVIPMRLESIRPSYSTRITSAPKSAIIRVA